VFNTISPNAESEESGMRDDSGMQDVAYNEVSSMLISPHCSYSLLEYVFKDYTVKTTHTKNELIADLFSQIFPITLISLFFMIFVPRYFKHLVFFKTSTLSIIG